MVKNYFLVAWRNLVRNRTFSMINILGLALGLASSLSILLWVQDERSVDAFHRNGDRLYYVFERNYMGGKLQTWYWTQGPLAEELKKEIPEVQAATLMSWSNVNTFAAGNKLMKEDGFAAGADYFTMFSYPLLEGSAKDALNSPDGLAISRKMAVAFFGSPAAAIGKAIRYENKKDFMVKAVFEDLIPQVSLQANYIMSWSGYLEDGNGWANDWGAVDPRTCVLLRPGSDVAAVEAKLLDVFRTEAANLSGVQNISTKSEGITGQLSVIFAVLAIFISCLGLLGLSLFTAEQRVREIGIRKVLGASVGSLFSLLSKNFLGLVGLAFLVGAPLGWWAMHQWLAGFAYRTDIPWWTFAIAGAAVLAVTLLTVCWQTIRAARTNPVKILRTE